MQVNLCDCKLVLICTPEADDREGHSAQRHKMKQPHLNLYFWMYWTLDNVTTKHVLGDCFACYSTAIYSVFLVKLLHREP